MAHSVNTNEEAVRVDDKLMIAEVPVAYIPFGCL
jgi:hypothetical protein